MYRRIPKSGRNGHPPEPIDWVKLDRWPRATARRSRALSLVDLFCGCGGRAWASGKPRRRQRRRLDIRFAFDFSPHCVAVYRANFRIAARHVLKRDVDQRLDGELGGERTQAESGWVRKVGELDPIVAGPPCQGHSDLNNSTRRADPRNEYYMRWFCAAELLCPKAVVIENVPTVLLDRKRVVDRAADWFARNGYQVTQDTIRLERFAIPQQRKRHFLVAVRQGAFLLSDLDDVNTRRMTAGEFLAGLEDEPDTRPEMFYQPPSMTHANRDRVDRLFEHDIHNLPNEFRPACHRDNAHQYISMYGRVHWDRPAQTLTSGFGSMGQGRYVHPTRKRLLTPHEAARLQGIPDFFDFSAAGSRTSLREMIANAVPPQFTATLVERLITRGLV